MTDAERMCKAAIAYADLGFLVLPLWSAHDGRCDCGKADCTSPGKHPHGRLAPHGLKDATRDAKVICSWFADGQVVNVGIATGPRSKLVVLDVDTRHNGMDSMAALGAMPRTATVETGGGGWHLYFQWPDGLDIRNSAGKLGPGLDIRGAGGYVVAPPSVHVSGGVYKWSRDPRGGFADLPQHILEKLIEKPAAAASATVEGRIPKGKRDTVLTSLAGTMRRRGMSETEILAALRETNKRCDPPLVESQLVKIAASIGKKKPGQLIGGPACRSLRLEPAAPFPVDALPQPVAHFVDGAAGAIGCDPSYVALPLLAGLASAIGNTRRIHLKHSWCEPAIVWGVIVGDSGTLKSPALEVALRPIRRRQQAAMKEFTEAMEAYRVQLMQYEKELTAWKRPSAGGEPPVKPEEPQADRCWCDDTTIEALAVLLQQNPRGLLLKRDELAGWLGSFDRYSQGKGADAAKWLEMFGGRSIMVDRKSGQFKTIYIQRAAVSVAGGIQPETLRRALGVEHRENGLAARLLLACPSRQAKQWTEADISHEIEARMETLFDKLYSLQLVTHSQGDARPLDLPLTAQAKTAWVNFYNDHAKEQEELTGDLAAAWSKLEGYAARLGLIVHLVRWAAGDATLDNPNMIDERSIEAGVRLSRWFGHEASRVYAILGESEEDRERRRLIEAIQRKGGSVTVRDLMRATRTLGNAEGAERALDELSKAGYGHWEDPPIGATGGHPTRRFVLDPGVDVDRTLDSGTVPGVVSTSTVSTGTDNSDEQEERAAILEYDAELPRQVAEERASGSEEGA